MPSALWPCQARAGTLTPLMTRFTILVVFSMVIFIFVVPFKTRPVGAGSYNPAPLGRSRLLAGDHLLHVVGRDDARPFSPRLLDLRRADGVGPEIDRAGKPAECQPEERHALHVGRRLEGDKLVSRAALARRLVVARDGDPLPSSGWLVSHLLSHRTGVAGRLVVRHPVGPLAPPHVALVEPHVGGAASHVLRELPLREPRRLGTEPEVEHGQ